MLTYVIYQYRKTMPERFAIRITAVSALSLFGALRRAAAVGGYCPLIAADGAFLAMVPVVHILTPISVIFRHYIAAVAFHVMLSAPII